MTATLDESPDRHRWTFDAHRITRLSVEPSALRIETWTLEASAEVRIAVPFRYREPDGSARTIDPAEPEQLAPLLPLLQRRLELLDIARAGEITLRFGDGSELRCAPRGRDTGLPWAAWEVHGGGALEGIEYRGVSGEPPWPPRA
ncbi:MAG: DUF6188 family protein [Gemmatimonadaceae bacterium]